MGEGVTEIGSRAFAGTSLSEFVIPANIPVNGEALEGIELSNIRLSADATDEQVAEWSAGTAIIPGMTEYAELARNLCW